MKTLFIFITLSLLAACSEQPYTENEFLSTQVKMLQTFCEQRQSCIDEVEQHAVGCEQQHAKDLDVNAMSDEEQIMSAGMFGACIIKQMDEPFQTRFNQAFPVIETEVTITRPSLNNPNILQIESYQGQFKILDQLVDEDQVKKHLLDNHLAEKYESAVLILESDFDTGVLIGVMDQIQNAKFDKVSLHRRED